METAVPPPNVGPEPPGLLASLQARFSGIAKPTPGPYDLTDPQLLEQLKTTRTYCEAGREVYEWAWWRNMQYFLGRQWIYFHPTAREWRDVRLYSWIPKPVTNKVRVTEQTIRAMLSDVQNGINARPVGGNPKNILTAQTVDDLAPLLHTEHEMDARLTDADFWAILFGNLWLHPFWDADDDAHTREVNLDVCRMCQTESGPDEIVAAKQRCPACGSGALMPATHPDGSPKMRTILVGKGKTHVVSPLELLTPFYAQKDEQVDQLVRLVWRPRHQVEDEYGADLTRKITWTKDPTQRSLQLYRSLAYQSDLSLEPSLMTTGAFSADTEGTTEQHLWIRPSKKYPGGLHVRFLGDAAPIVARVSDSLELPYADVQGKKLWPWAHYQYEPIGGRLYGQGAIDSFITKQNSLNQVDSMTELTVKRMGNPVWLQPKGAEINRFTGFPGQVIEYQPAGAQGAKPERIPGENPPQGAFTLRAQYLQDIEEDTGTYDVVKGAKPSGIEAFSALQLLVERSQSRFTTLFKGRGRAYREWFELALELERVHGPTERVQAIMGPNNSWNFQTFKKENLRGAITIVVEDGSNVPKTTLGRRAAIEHLNQLGMLNPADPDQQYAIMQEFGTQHLIPNLDADVKAALSEQDAFEQWAAKGFQGPMPLVRMPWHNDRVHLAQNRRWMNSDRVREVLESLAANPAAQAAIVQGLATHLQVHADALIGLQPQPAPGPGGAGASPGAAGAGQAMNNSNQNSDAAGLAAAPPNQPAAL